MEVLIEALPLAEKERKIESVGWVCPVCGSVHAPDVKKCKCVKTASESESSADTRKLLLE